jgi:hypothetical protein
MRRELFERRRTIPCGRAVAGLALAVLCTAPASAQIDPLIFLKSQTPNVVFVVDTAGRMQRSAPTDPSTQATSRVTSDYYDPHVYTRNAGAPDWEKDSLGVTAAMPTYRRLYKNFGVSNPALADKYTTTSIQVVGSNNVAVPAGTIPSYGLFDAATRLAIARAAMHQVVNENKNVARFGLVKTRQQTPAVASAINSAVVDAAANQVEDTDSGSHAKWNVYRATVGATKNGAYATSGLVVQADAATANTDVLNNLGVDARGLWTGVGAAPNPLPAPLIPTGGDTDVDFDTPVKLMLDDAKTEVARLIAINNDPTCRNTIVVLIVGGGEGNTTAGATNATLGTTATTFTNISSRRVPIYVIAIAPPTSDVASLKAIAANSGGQYFEITSAQIAAALASPLQTATAGASAPSDTVIVPEVVKAISTAVQHAFATSTNFSATPAALPRADATLPVGIVTEFPVTSPIVSTVNLNQAKDVNGATLPNPQPPDVKDKQGTLIPQRNNVMVTTGFALPGFDGILRGFRVYKPVVDATQASGYKFSADGTALWIASTPADPDLRNLYTALADGTIVALNTQAANLALLAPLMNLTSADASAVITSVRSLPLGAVVDSTPAFLNPPSLDPPPDDAYPGFATANKNRRTLIWVGTNRGMLEAIDARTGLEVWGFVPLNLLPKLRTLRDGQPVGTFDFFVDGSAKVSDVKLPGTCDADHPSDCWHTHLIMGEGPGGTFYQSVDVTMTGLSSCVAADDDTQATLLGCFSSTTRITLNWAFPSYSSFDPTISVPTHCDPVTGLCDSMPYGDLKATATAIEKTVGQTWSDPAVGEIGTSAGPYAILLGSGFLPYATQQLPNRCAGQSPCPAGAGIVAGTTFYVVSAKDGTVYATSSVGSDGLNETVNNCQANASGCKQIKNALQTDPVATGPSDQRYVSKAYLGDLDGSVWRFDIGLDGALKPIINSQTKLITIGTDQPIFNSMATVNVGGVNQYIFFGTGSDLLPATDKNTTYHLLAVLDTGAATGPKSFDRAVTKTSQGNNVTSDERVTAFPAVAGDIVFFTTTTITPSSMCTAPSANLYAFTFTGGAAYDTNNSGTFTNADSVLVKTVAGQRATAPFIVDQHLMFGTGGSISMFGDANDYNNGIGQAGVRILSWREVR